MDADGNQIKWTYLEQLNNQNFETFHLANKLKDRHINFKNERMKVKLATQLFSLSVAEAIKFCREDLRLESFKFSDPCLPSVLQIKPGPHRTFLLQYQVPWKVQQQPHS